MDKDIKDMLSNMYEGIQRDKFAAEQRRLKKLWQPLPSPISFSNILEKLTKDELRLICYHYDLKKLSSLKKDPLIAELVKTLPRKVSEEVKLMDEDRYLFLKGFVEKDITTLTIIDAEDFETEEIEYWRKTGLIFSATWKKEKVVFMPPEIANAFRKLESETTQKVLKRNTEWILLTQGMLYYYGILGFHQILLQLEDLTGIKPDYLELHNILSRAKEYYGMMKTDSYGRWAYVDVHDSEEIYKEQRSRSDVDYHKFSKSKLLKAGEPDFKDENPAFRRFAHFLLDHYKMAENEAKEIAYECQQIIQRDLGTSGLVSFLETRIEFPAFEFMQLVTRELVYLSNHTRRWILKGHTPDELSSVNTESLSPYPTLPFDAPLLPVEKPYALAPSLAHQKNGVMTGQPTQPTKTASNIVDMRTRQKIGRNDPCPCGSGKKFKQCCGKG